jgi:hypothetical protein
MVLSEYPHMMEEFARYSRVVYPDRRDYQEYMLAYENVLTKKTTDKEKE